ncbi:cytochrome c [Myxococcaceae bacterium GXIMD 01537]
MGRSGTASEVTEAARPAVVGDVEHGWRVYQEHCASCHGATRRGDGELRGTLAVPAQDLRDPLFLVKRTDDELAGAIFQGGVFVRRSKEMPGFAADLSEQDVMDLIALLRGDAISLEECFARATHYRRVFMEKGGPPVLAAYETGPARSGRPVVLGPDEPPPPGARRVGYVLFAEMELPGAGRTPTAFVANLQGSITGMRVALPEPHARRARADLEDVVLRRVPKLPGLVPVLDESAQRLSSLVRAAPAETATP